MDADVVEFTGWHTRPDLDGVPEHRVRLRFALTKTAVVGLFEQLSDQLAGGLSPSK